MPQDLRPSCSPRTAGPTTLSRRSACVAQNISSSTYLVYKLLLLARDMGESVKFVPPLHFSFLTRPRAAHEAKPGSERRDPGGIKGELAGLPPGHGQTSFPWCLTETTGGLSLTYPHVSLFSPCVCQEHIRLSKWTCQYVSCTYRGGSDVFKPESVH